MPGKSASASLVLGLPRALPEMWRRRAMRLSRSSSLTERETRSGVNSDLRSWPSVVGSAFCGIDMSIDVAGGDTLQAAPRLSSVRLTDIEDYGGPAPTLVSRSEANGSIPLPSRWFFVIFLFCGAIVFANLFHYVLFRVIRRKEATSRTRGSGDAPTSCPPGARDLSADVRTHRPAVCSGHSDEHPASCPARRLHGDCCLPGLVRGRLHLHRAGFAAAPL